MYRRNSGATKQNSKWKYLYFWKLSLSNFFKLSILSILSTVRNINLMLLNIEEKHRENFPEGIGCVNCKRRKRITRQKDIKAERRKDKFGKMPKSQLGSVVSAAVIGECNLWQLVVEKLFLVFEIISFHPERILQQSFGRGTNQFSFRLISLSLQYRPKPQDYQSSAQVKASQGARLLHVWLLLPCLLRACSAGRPEIKVYFFIIPPLITKWMKIKIVVVLY